MAMTIRLLDGTSIQYNTASYAWRSSSGYTDIYTKKDGDWVAQVPTGAVVIECVPACRIYKATTDYRDVRLEQVEKELRGMKRLLTAVLKQLPKPRPPRSHSQGKRDV